MPHALVLYHYMPPDEVVSARQLGDLAEGLVARGWRVTAMPSARRHKAGRAALPGRERMRSVRYRRVYRPDWDQSRLAGRLANTAWMLLAWVYAAINRRMARDVDVVIVGTDPLFGVLAGWAWKLFRPRVKVVHWCFDLHPEAAVADGMAAADAPGVRALKALLKRAYRRCDLIVDIGPCMADRLAAYEHGRARTTLTPWALAEPDAPLPVDPAQRAEVFGDARLGLSYSGSFGQAHSHELLLALARSLGEQPMRLAFSVGGHRADVLRAAVGDDDANVAFVPFAPLEKLPQRLGCADVHVMSLKDEWTGTVVPSKFFGALAAGRPVVFAGSEDAAIARWIRQYRVGWVLTRETLPAVANDMARLCDRPGELAAMRQRCWAVYRRRFSRRSMLDAWDAALRGVLAGRAVSRPAAACGRASNRQAA